MYHRVMADERDEIRSASRALKDAATALSRALGQTLAEASSQAGRELTEELLQATRDLNAAAVQMGWDQVRRSPKAERTRAELLAAARRVFAERGYEGASVGDVAAAAGYTKGAVYANFGSKEELFLELAREYTAQDAALASSAQTPDLRKLFAVYPVSDERTTQTLIALEMYLYAIRHPEARTDLAPLFGAAFEGVAALVHRSATGSSSGQPTQDERDLAFALVALHSLGAIASPLLPEGTAAATVGRLVDRLLAD